MLLASFTTLHLVSNLHIILKSRIQIPLDRAATGKTLVVTLTYGGRTVNQTDSLYQIVNGIVGNIDWGESLTVVAYEFRGLTSNMELNHHLHKN